MLCGARLFSTVVSWPGGAVGREVELSYCLASLDYSLQRLLGLFVLFLFPFCFVHQHECSELQREAPVVPPFPQLHCPFQYNHNQVHPLKPENKEALTLFRYHTLLLSQLRFRF